METAAPANRATHVTLTKGLLCLLVLRVFTTPTAVFYVLHPARLFLLVLGRGVIPVLAIGAL